MKKIVLLTLLLLCTMHGFAQTEGISYQAVILNPNAQEIPGVNAKATILANSQVAIQFTIVDDLGNIEYEEYHRTSTDAYGMINLLIGGGSPTGNAIFRDVFWDGYSKTLKVGIDFSGSGANYTTLGEQKLSYMPQPTNPDIVAAIEENTTAVAAIAATISTSGGSIDPATAENTLAIAEEITRATLAESTNANAIALNTAKAGLTSAQETVLSNISGSNSGDQDISGITTNATAIALNTAKAGLTSAQETLLGNTSGENSGDQDISGIATNTTAIALNTAKTGITSDQATAIATNSSKVGLSSAQETLLGNTSGENSGDQNISGIATNATAIALNTAKTGITSDQATAITANSSKVGVPSTYTLPNADGDANQVLATDGTGAVSWTTPATVSPAAFSTTSNVTSNSNGTILTDDFVFGSTALHNISASTDDDKRMFFDKSKGAFRVGRTIGTQWNESNVGEYSTAMGDNTIASGLASTAMGQNTTAPSFAETTIGRNNTVYTPSSATSHVVTDRLFTIGNGINSGSKSDALVMLKNGNTTLKGQLTLTDGSDGYTLPNTDGDANQVLATDGNGAVSWSSPATVIPAAFSTTSNVTSNSNGTILTDDFVFGSSSLDHNNADGLLDSMGMAYEVSRMFFDKSKGAFRVGTTNGSFWNEGNVGDHSIAMGYNAKASSEYALAMGDRSNATGTASIAMGMLVNASGENSLAMGRSSKAIGKNAMATGYFTQANGDRSTAMGVTTNAQSYGETAIGLYSAHTASANASSIVATDRLFVIGNGTSTSNKSNALVMLKNGNTTLKGQLTLTDGSDSYTLPNTDGDANQVLATNGNGDVSWSTPAAGGSSTFDTTSNVTSNGSGDTATDDFVFGSSTLNYIVSSDGSRMFFDKSKSAFRAGYANTNDWDDVNIGQYSIALGRSSTASAKLSTAMGDRNVSSGIGSTAIGDQNTSSGYFSIAMGTRTKATGSNSIAMGRTTEASGANATAIGLNTTAPSFSETTIGRNNTVYTPSSATSHVSTDRLFTIGNGTNSGFKSDALVMLKDGTTTVSGNWSGPTFTSTSDIRLKEDIADLGLGMAVLKQINTKQYHLKKDLSKQLRFGVIAQELREILPNLVYGEEGENSYLSVNYTELIPILINALKEQDTKINALENQNLVLLELVQRVEDLEKK